MLAEPGNGRFSCALISLQVYHVAIVEHDLAYKDQASNPSKLQQIKNQNLNTVKYPNNACMYENNIDLRMRYMLGLPFSAFLQAYQRIKLLF